MRRRGIGRVGGVLWVLVAQYFVMLFVVQSAWSEPYSWIRNAISDLGAATCFWSTQVDAQVCSPWHFAAGASWVVAGMCLAVGAMLMWQEFPPTRAARWGLRLYVLSGAGLVVVGLNPEDTSVVPHTLGAVIAIGSGLVAMLLTALALQSARRWVVLARIGIIATVLAMLSFVIMFARVGGPGLFGLWERIAAFPILLWAIVCGLATLITAARDDDHESSVRARPDAVRRSSAGPLD